MKTLDELIESDIDAAIKSGRHVSDIHADKRPDELAAARETIAGLVEALADISRKADYIANAALPPMHVRYVKMSKAECATEAGEIVTLARAALAKARGEATA